MTRSDPAKPPALARRDILGRAAALLSAPALIGVARASTTDGKQSMQLRKFDVTIRVFDPSKGLGSGEDYILPVDSPDEEHAAASTLSNTISFTRKTSGNGVLPVAFCCVKVAPRAS